MKNILLFLLVVLIIYLWRTIRYNRAIRNQCGDMAQTIKEQLIYNEELSCKKEENLALREEIRLLEKKVKILSDEKQLSRPEMQLKSSVVSTEEAEISPETNTDAVMQALFEKAVREIVCRKLFLNPDFSKEELLKVIYIPKNKFSQLFKQYAGVSFLQYVNTLRMDHAVRMLLDYPDYTIESISNECGITNVKTFYRLFSDRFGVTPTDFRTGKRCLIISKIMDEREDLRQEEGRIDTTIHLKTFDLKYPLPTFEQN